MIMSIFDNLKYINKIWEIFDCINDKLIKFGIIIHKLEKENNYFIISLDIIKISPDSIAAKYNINDFTILCQLECLKMIASNNIKICPPVYIDSFFPIYEILKNIFKIIGKEDIYDETNIYLIENIDAIINNINDNETYKEYKKILENLNKYVEIIKQNKLEKEEIIQTFKNAKDTFEELLKREKQISYLDAQIHINFLESINLSKINIEKILEKKIKKLNLKNNNKKKEKLKNEIKNYEDIIKSKQDEINNNDQSYLFKKVNEEKEQIKIFCNTKYNNFKSICDYKDELHKKFFLETLNFEKILFLEIFNQEKELEFFKNINVFKTKYTYLIKEIKEYLNEKNFETLDILKFIQYINNNI